MFDNEFASQELASSADATPINFTADVPSAPSEAIDFSADKPLQSLPLAVSDNRAAKAHFAMGDASPGIESLKGSFANGGEWDTRTQMADAEATEQQVRGMAMVQKLAQAQGPVAPVDTDLALNILKTHTVDPATILEGKFAKAFTQFGATVRPDINNIFSKGWQQFPGTTAFEQYVATDLQTKKQISTSIKEEYEDKWKKTTWMGDDTGYSAPTFGEVLTGPAKAKGALDAYALSSIPFMTWSRMSDILGKVPGIFPGTNMASTIRSLYATSQGPEEFNRRLRAGADALWAKNPLDALTLVRAAEMFSDGDELLGNSFGWADIATTLPVGSLIKGAKGLSTFLSKERISGAPSGAGRALEADNIATSPQYSGVTGSRVPTEAAPTVSKDAFEPVQLDLFHGDPRQGDLFAGSRPGEGIAPDVTTGLPPGKLRSTYEPLAQQDARIAANEEKSFRNPFTGRLEKSVASRTQGELPLGLADTQLTLFERLLGEGNAAVKEDLVGQVRQGFADIIKAGGDKGKIDPEIVFNGLGDTETAAKIGVNRINKILAELDATGAVKAQSADIKGLYELGKDLPSNFNPVGLTVNPVNLSRARAQQLADRLAAVAASFKSLLADSMGVERLAPEALEQAYKDTAANLKHEFHTYSDHILDQFIKGERDPETNTRQSIILMGNRGKLPFESKEQAEVFAKDIFGIEGRSSIIYQKGIGYFIAVTKPLDETASSVRALTTATKFSQIPINRWSNLIFGTWNPRTAEDMLSRHIQEAAHTATHSPQNLRAMFKQIADENISNLSRKDRNEVQDVLRSNRDTEIAGQRGIFAKSIGEFETMFYGEHGWYPTFEQTNAYFSFLQLNDMDWYLRNVGVLRDKLIKGIEEHNFMINGGKTPWLEGKVLKSFPTAASEDSGLMIVRYHDQAPDYIRRHSQLWDTDAINKLMEEGYSLIQLAEPHTRPLMQLTGEKDVVNFVLTNTKETRSYLGNRWIIIPVDT
jgi:hypothetical protein